MGLEAAWDSSFSFEMSLPRLPTSNSSPNHF